MASDAASLLGWLYAACWSVSFYPTILLNCRIRSSDSISLDYIVLNFLGYACYTTSIYLQVYNKDVRKQFKQAFAGGAPLLSISDLAYSAHGLMINSVVFSQIVFGNRLWGFRNTRVSFRLNRMTKLFYCLFVIFCLWTAYHWDEDFQLMNFTLNLSYFKIMVSFTKNFPQVFYNLRRRSMYGISRLQILLDLTGCFFSLLELVLRNSGTLYMLVNSNRSKIGIILVTLVFDLIFLVQFALFHDKRDPRDAKAEQLLPASSPVDEKDVV